MDAVSSSSPKTPLPFVVAQTTTNSWQIHFVPNNRTYSARADKRPRRNCRAASSDPMSRRWRSHRRKNWQWERLMMPMPFSAPQSVFRGIDRGLFESMSRKAWYWIILILGLLVIGGMMRLRFDVDVLNLLPSDLPVVHGLALYQKFHRLARTHHYCPTSDPAKTEFSTPKPSSKRFAGKRTSSRSVISAAGVAGNRPAEAAGTHWLSLAKSAAF